MVDLIDTEDEESKNDIDMNDINRKTKKQIKRFTKILEIIAVNAYLDGHVHTQKGIFDKRIYRENLKRRIRKNLEGRGF